MLKTIFVCFVLSLAAFAQQFQHIVIVVQENRTPDNLFGYCAIPGADLQTSPPIPLVTGYDITHTHAAFLVDQAGGWPSNSLYSVQASDVQPYCQLAAQYGFANRMFQTNQGPSFPAHQFIFCGTSAPSESSNLFAAENATGSNCMAGLAPGRVAFIDPSGAESSFGVPCFERPTLTDELDAASLSWKYYAPNGIAIWNAPAAIRHICQPNTTGRCIGADWHNVILNPAQVLADISGGNLPSVSWVIPAGANSDHSGMSTGGGPAWVSSIVNAIGQSPYWQDTAILVTWDDWGGWYDHVAPYSSAWAPWYVGGFRVPLVFISAYTPAMVDNQQHDFGSLLRFVESNFSLALIGPGTWADAYADDLSAFYPLQSPQPFQPVRSRKLTHQELTDVSDPDND